MNWYVHPAVGATVQGCCMSRPHYDELRTFRGETEQGRHCEIGGSSCAVVERRCRHDMMSGLFNVPVASVSTTSCLIAGALADFFFEMLLYLILLCDNIFTFLLFIFLLTSFSHLTSFI